MGFAITGVTDLRREARLGLWLSHRLCSSVEDPLRHGELKKRKCTTHEDTKGGSAFEG